MDVDRLTACFATRLGIISITHNVPAAIRRAGNRTISIQKPITMKKENTSKSAIQPDLTGSLLLFTDIRVGMKVIDRDGITGIVKDCKDIHNILVKYENGGSGLYCLVEGCADETTINDQVVEIPHYDPLYVCK